MNKVIILLGQRVRSGTNFIGSTLSMHPEITTIPPSVSLGEFNLYKTDAILEIFDGVAKSSFGIDLNEKDQDAFLENYGQQWIELLKSKYEIPEGQTIFIKSPHIAYSELWIKTFPNARIALLCRDGRDNVVSSVKASNDRRTWHTMSIKFKKRLNYLLGRSFINHAKQWSLTARQFAEIHESERLKKFSYETLNDSPEGIEALLKHFQLQVNDEILKGCLNAPVVGSSFGDETKDITRPNWQPDHDKSKFKFSRKWTHWGPIKRRVFKMIAGKELILLGFESNNKW